MSRYTQSQFVPTPSLFDSLEANKRKHPHEHQSPPTQFFIGLFDSTPIPDDGSVSQVTVIPTGKESYTYQYNTNNYDNDTNPDTQTKSNDSFNEDVLVLDEHNKSIDENDNNYNDDDNDDYFDHTPFTNLSSQSTHDYHYDEDTQVEYDEHMLFPLLRNICIPIEQSVSHLVKLPPNLLSTKFGVNIKPWQFYIGLYILLGAPYYTRDEFYKDIFPGPLFEVFSPQRLHKLGIWGMIKAMWINSTPKVLHGEETIGEFVNSFHPLPLYNYIVKLFLNMLPREYRPKHHHDVMDTNNTDQNVSFGNNDSHNTTVGGDADNVDISNNNNNNNNNNSNATTPSLDTTLNPTNHSNNDTNPFNPFKLLGKLFNTTGSFFQFLYSFITHNVKRTTTNTLSLLHLTLKEIQRILINIFKLTFPFGSQIIDTLNDINTLNPFKCYSIIDFATQIGNFFVNHVIMKPYLFIYPLNLFSAWYPVTFIDMIMPGLPVLSTFSNGLYYRLPPIFVLFSNCDLLINLPLYFYKRLVLKYQHSTPYTIGTVLQHSIRKFELFFEFIFYHLTQISTLTTQVVTTIPFIIYHYWRYVQSVSELLDKYDSLQHIVLNYQKFSIYSRILHDNVIESYLDQYNTKLFDKIKYIQDNNIKGWEWINDIHRLDITNINNTNINNTSIIPTTPSLTTPQPTTLTPLIEQNTSNTLHNTHDVNADGDNDDVITKTPPNTILLHTIRKLQPWHTNLIMGKYLPQHMIQTIPPSPSTQRMLKLQKLQHQFGDVIVDTNTINTIASTVSQQDARDSVRTIMGPINEYNTPKLIASTPTSSSTTSNIPTITASEASRAYFESQLEMALLYYKQQSLDNAISHQTQLLYQAQIDQLNNLSLSTFPALDHSKAPYTMTNDASDGTLPGTDGIKIGGYYELQLKHTFAQNALVAHFQALRDQLGPKIVKKSRFGLKKDENEQLSNGFDQSSKNKRTNSNSEYNMTRQYQLIKRMEENGLYLLTMPATPVFLIYTLPPPTRQYQQQLQQNQSLSSQTSSQSQFSSQGDHITTPRITTTKPTSSSTTVNSSSQQASVPMFISSPNLVDHPNIDNNTNMLITTKDGDPITNTPTTTSSINTTATITATSMLQSSPYSNFYQNISNIGCYQFPETISTIDSSLHTTDESTLSSYLDLIPRHPSSYNDDDVFVQIGITASGQVTTLIQFTQIYLQNSQKMMKNVQTVRQVEENRHIHKLQASLRDTSSQINSLTPSVELTLAEINRNVGKGIRGFLTNFKTRASDIASTITNTLFFHQNDDSNNTSTTNTTTNKPKSRFIKKGNNRLLDDDDDVDGGVVVISDANINNQNNILYNSQQNTDPRAEFSQFHSLAMLVDNTSPYSIEKLPIDIIRNADLNQLSEHNAQRIESLLDLQGIVKYLTLTPLELTSPLLNNIIKSQYKGIDNSNINKTQNQSLSIRRQPRKVTTDDSNSNTITPHQFPSGTSIFTKIGHYLGLVVKNFPSLITRGTVSILSHTISGLYDFVLGLGSLSIKILTHMITTMPLALIALVKRIFIGLKFLFKTLIKIIYTIISTALRLIFNAITYPIKLLFNLIIIKPYNYIRRLFSALFYHFSLSRFLFNIIPPMPKLITYPIRLILSPLAASLILLDTILSSQAYFLLFLPIHLIGTVFRGLLRFIINRVKATDALLYHYVWKYVEHTHTIIVTHFPMVGVLLPLPDLFGHYTYLRDAFEVTVIKFGPNYYLQPLLQTFYALFLKLPLHILSYLARQVMHIFHIRDYLIYLATIDFISPVIHAVLHFADFFVYFVNHYISLGSLPAPIQSLFSNIKRVYTTTFDHFITPTYSLISTVWNIVFSYKNILRLFNIVDEINENYLPDLYRFNPVQRDYELVFGSTVARRLNALRHSVQDGVLGLATSIPYLTDNPEMIAKINHPMSWDIDTTNDIQPIKLQNFITGDIGSVLPAVNDIPLLSSFTSFVSASGTSAKTRRVDFVSSTMHALAALPSYEAWLRTFLPYLGMYNPVSTFLQISSHYRPVSETTMFRSAIKDLKQYWHRNDGTERYSPRELREIIERQQFEGVFYGTSVNYNDSISSQSTSSQPSTKSNDLVPLHPLLVSELAQHPASAGYNNPMQTSTKPAFLPASLSVSQLLGLGKSENINQIPFKHHEPHEFFVVYLQQIVTKLVEYINQQRLMRYKNYLLLWQNNYNALLQKKQDQYTVGQPSKDLFDTQFANLGTNGVNLYKNNNIAKNNDPKDKKNQIGPNIPPFEPIPLHTPYVQPPASFYTTTLTTCQDCGVTRSIQSQQQLSLLLQPFACTEFIPLQGLVEQSLRSRGITGQQYCDVCDLKQKIQLGHRLIAALQKQITKRFDESMATITNLSNSSNNKKKVSVDKKRVKLPGYTYGDFELLNPFMDDSVYNTIYSDRYSFQTESYQQTLIRLQVEVINLQYQLLLCFHPSLALFYQQEQATAIYRSNMLHLNDPYNGNGLHIDGSGNVVLHSHNKDNKKNKSGMKITLPFSTFDFLLQKAPKMSSSTLLPLSSLPSLSASIESMRDKAKYDDVDDGGDALNREATTTTNKSTNKKQQQTKAKGSKGTTKGRANTAVTPRKKQDESLFDVLELGKYITYDRNSSDYSKMSQLTSLSSFSTLSSSDYTLPSGSETTTLINNINNGTSVDQNNTNGLSQPQKQVGANRHQYGNNGDHDDVDFVYVTITIKPSGATTTKLRFIQPTISSFLASKAPFPRPESTEQVIINLNAKHTPSLRPLIQVIQPQIPYFDFYLRRIPQSLPPIIKPIPNKTSDYTQQSFITTLPNILPIAFQIFNHATGAKINTKIAFPTFFNASNLLPALHKRSLDQPTGLDTINMSFYRSQRPTQLTTGAFATGLTSSFPDIEGIDSIRMKHPEEEYRDREDKRKELLLQRQRQALLDLDNLSDDDENDPDLAAKKAILKRMQGETGGNDDEDDDDDDDTDDDNDDDEDANKDTKNKKKKKGGKRGKKGGINMLDEEIDVTKLDPRILLPKPLHEQLAERRNPKHIPHYDRGHYTTNPLFSGLNIDASQYDEYVVRRDHLAHQRKLFFTSIQPLIGIDDNLFNNNNNNQQAPTQLHPNHQKQLVNDQDNDIINDVDTYLYVVMSVIVYFGHSLDDPNAQFVTYRRVLPTLNLDAVGRRRNINWTNGYCNPALTTGDINIPTNSKIIPPFSPNTLTPPFPHPDPKHNNTIPSRGEFHYQQQGIYNTQMGYPATNPPSQSKPKFNFDAINHNSSLGIIGMGIGINGNSGMDQYQQLPTMMAMSTTSPYSLSTDHQYNSNPLGLTNHLNPHGDKLHGANLDPTLTMYKQHQENHAKFGPINPFDATTYAAGLREAFLFDHNTGTKRTVKQRYRAVRDWLKLHSTWVLCTNNGITPTSEYTVMSSVPYMVFYERI